MNRHPDTMIVTLTLGELAAMVRETSTEAVVAAALNPPKEVLMLDEVAELLGRHKKTIPTLVKEAGLPAHRISERELRFRRSEVLAWLSAQPSTPPAELKAS